MYVILLSILCYDIWFYVSHVLLHKAWVYRRIHWIHHQKIEPTALDTYEGHMLEGLLQSLGTVVPFFFMHYTWLDVVLVLIFLNARGMARHDVRMVWLVGNHHLLHHRFPQWNYGEYWLDWLCGTLYPGDGCTNGRTKSA